MNNIKERQSYLVDKYLSGEHMDLEELKEYKAYIKPTREALLKEVRRRKRAIFLGKMLNFLRIKGDVIVVPPGDNSIRETNKDK